MRPRRCLLFMPGDDLKKIQKGISLGVDSIVMDLEDGVALNRKAEARATIATALRDLHFGRSERVVRINPIGSGLEQADLDAVLPQQPDSIMLPKVEHAEHIHWLAEAIADPAIRLLAIIETARGVVNLRDIAAVSDRLDALDLRRRRSGRRHRRDPHESGLGSLLCAQRRRHPCGGVWPASDRHARASTSTTKPR